MPPSLHSGPVHATSDTTRLPHHAGRRRRAVVVRVAVSGICAATLPMLSAWSTHAPDVRPTESTRAAALASRALDAIDPTSVLIVVAALAVVALVRQLPYGVGVVIGCTIGALLTDAVVRHVVGTSIPTADLPSGHVVAAASLLGAASMVVSARWRPVTLGVGTVVTSSVAAATLIVGSASIIGVMGAASIAFAWWSACSVAMLYSPAAAARDARNPFDTAALAVRRRTGRSR